MRLPDDRIGMIIGNHHALYLDDDDAIMESAMENAINQVLDEQIETIRDTVNNMKNKYGNGEHYEGWEAAINIITKQLRSK